MYRKSSLQGGRRSSQLRRLSSAKAEVALDKEYKIQSEGKKSLIPISIGYSSRSSSTERDGALGNSSRLPRSGSDPCLEVSVKSVSRSRSSENLTTPKNLMKTPRTGSRLTKPSTSKKSARRDTRPLADRGFQNLELSKVQQYLLSEGIIEHHKINEVRSTLSIKLFIHIMNSLLKKFIPSINLTTANYCEEIMHCMKKLKYPGSLSRSFLLSAYTPHSWPHILGLMSWLTQILPVGTCPLKYLVADSALEHSELIDVISYTSKRYVEWNERDDYSFDEDKNFCKNFFKEKCEALDYEISVVDQEVECLEECKRKSEEEYKALQKEYDSAMNDLAAAEKRLVQVKLDCEKLRLSIENGKEELRMLDEEIEKLQSVVPSGASGSTGISDLDIERVQTDLVSAENKFKFQEKQENEMCSQVYSLDLRIARTKAEIDKRRLQREALLRECVVLSEHMDLEKLLINVDCKQPDYKVQMKQYQSDLAGTLNNLRLLLQSVRNAREGEENTVRKLTESLKQLEVKKEKANEKHACLQKKVEEKKEVCTVLEEKNKLSREKLRVKKEELAKKEQKLEAEREKGEQLLKEIAAKEEKQKQDQEKYANILTEGAKALEEHIDRCKNLIREELGEA